MIFRAAFFVAVAAVAVVVDDVVGTDLDMMGCDAVCDFLLNGM
jgi:hypothetical protein